MYSLKKGELPRLLKHACGPWSTDASIGITFTVSATSTHDDSPTYDILVGGERCIDAECSSTGDVKIDGSFHSRANEGS